MFFELISFIDALIRRVKDSEHHPLTTEAKEELDELDAQIYALCRRAELPIPELPCSPNYKPYGHTKVPQYRSNRGMTVACTQEWEQAMRGLRVDADLKRNRQSVPFDVFQQQNTALLRSPLVGIDDIIPDLNLNIVKADCRLVPGSQSSVCPKADPPLPREYLPAVVQAYGRLFPIPPGQTIHW